MSGSRDRQEGPPLKNTVLIVPGDLSPEAVVERRSQLNDLADDLIKAFQEVRGPKGVARLGIVDNSQSGGRVKVVLREEGRKPDGQ